MIVAIRGNVIAERIEITPCYSSSMDLYFSHFPKPLFLSCQNYTSSVKQFCVIAGLVCICFGFTSSGFVSVNQEGC